MAVVLRLASVLAGLAVRQAARRAAEVSLLLALAGLFLIIGLGGLATALAIWLSRLTDPLTAALVIGGAGMTLAGMLLLLARARARRRLRLKASLLGAAEVAPLLALAAAQTRGLRVWAPVLAVAVLAFLVGRGGGPDGGSGGASGGGPDGRA